MRGALQGTTSYFPDGRTLDAWRSLIAASAPSVSIRRDSIAGRFL
jgi:hypothetical protein